MHRTRWGNRDCGRGWLVGQHGHDTTPFGAHLHEIMHCAGRNGQAAALAQHGRDPCIGHTFLSQDADQFLVCLQFAGVGLRWKVAQDCVDLLLRVHVQASASTHGIPFLTDTE